MHRGTAASTAVTPGAGSSDGVVPVICVPLLPVRSSVYVDKQSQNKQDSQSSNHNAYDSS